MSIASLVCCRRPRACATRLAAALSLASAAACVSAAGNAAPPSEKPAAADLAGLPRRGGLPLERHPGVETRYGALGTPRGRVRTISTRPAQPQGPLPAILVVGWLSCDSVEIPQGGGDGFAKLEDTLVARSFAVVLRVDKPGVGDSEGDCAETDFAAELEMYRSALRMLRAEPGVDARRIVLVGLSYGGGILPLVADGSPVAGYVVSGGWYKTWFEHMLEIERRRLTLSGKAPGDVSATMKHVEQLYDLYLIEGMTPGKILAAHPELSDSWSDAPEHQYGRPVAFYRQLQALNLADAWSRVDAPVLAIHGEYDWIMSREDDELLARAVNAKRPGSAELVLVPRMDHFYAVHDDAVSAFNDRPSGRYTADAADRIVGWIVAHEGAAQR
jgi:pimeloyl-ACP methyl ester carboxylesterase